MNNMVVVERVVSRILARDLDSAMELIARDAELTVVPAEPNAVAETLRGRMAVGEYFESLGAIVSFWQVQLVPEGKRVLAVGRERYTTNAGLESDTEFMLVFQLRHGLVRRIVVLESLAAETALLPTVYLRAS